MRPLLPPSDTLDGPPLTLDGLRDVVARLERSYAATDAPAPLPFGLPDIDGALPGGGLPRGALHEVSGVGADRQAGAAPAMFAAGILARTEGDVLWVLERPDLFAPGLAAAGLHPDRVIYAHVASRDALLVAEDGLQHGGLAGVVAEVSGPVGLTASRRLQLAAERSGVTALLLRRPHATHATTGPARNGAEPAGAVAAVTRWCIAAEPSAPPIPEAPDIPGLGRAHWRLELLRSRGGQTGSWIVEACDASGRLGMVAPLAGQSAAQVPRRRRAAA